MIAAALSIIIANPQNLPKSVMTAKPGGTIVLEAGKYPPLVINRKMDRPVTIDARAAKISQVIFRNAQGWNWNGGDIVGPPSQFYGVQIDGSRKITISNVKFSGVFVGVSVYRGSEFIDIKGNVFDGVRSDGINVAWARRVNIKDNTCKNFHPIEKIFDSAGKLVKDGDHPDCVQMWSVKGRGATRDIVISGNHIYGRMQGINHFYHAPRPGMRNVIIYNNDINISFYHGITMENTKGLVVRGNTVRTIPGAKDQRGRPIFTWIKADGSPAAIVCGNVAAASAARYTAACK